MDPTFARAFSTVLLVLLALILIGVVIGVRSPSSASSRADRFSRHVRLPYGTERTRESVVRRLRVSSVTSAVTMLVTVVALMPLLLTPLALSPTFPIVAILPVFITTAFASAVVGVRERLFHPAPDAPRIARARALSAADYLDPFRRLLPSMLAVAAALSLALVVATWLREPESVDGAFGVTALYAAVATTALFIAVPLIDRRILAQPQPATETLELAWDDAFRSTALGALRLAPAIGAWITLSVAMLALWIGSDAPFASYALQLPTWGVIALQFVYPDTGRRMRPELYPEWLRRPAVVGGTA